MATALATEPHAVFDRSVFLGSRDCVLNASKRALLNTLDIKHILMACDRSEDAPREFNYLSVRVNNETRDSGDQHSRHVHDDEEGGCSHGDGGGCGDLHLMKWKVDAETGDAKCQAEVLCEWIDEKVQEGQKVLIHGYDGVTNSAAIAIAYIMWKGVRLSEALLRVEAVRPIVRLTPPILKDLKTWDTRLVVSRSDIGRIIPKRNNESKK